MIHNLEQTVHVKIQTERIGTFRLEDHIAGLAGSEEELIKYLDKMGWCFECGDLPDCQKYLVSVEPVTWMFK